MTERVTVVEVGARDGLQNEAKNLPASLRAELVRRLADAGMPEVEAGSFVSPRWVPQMASTEEVLAALPSSESVRFSVLVPNATGYTRAKEAGARCVSVFTAASNTFNLRNTNIDVAGSLERLAPVVQQARADGMRVRAYVSCVLGCPYEGAIPVSAVVDVAAALVAMGCEEISLGDTIGVGTPRKARAMLEACAGAVPMSQLAVHFHDTYGQALANVFACLEAGVRVVDASVAGLGGCPYARGAAGNLASEDLVYMLQGMGMETGVDLDALIEIARWISGVLGREPVSRLARVGGGACAQ